MSNDHAMPSYHFRHFVDGQKHRKSYMMDVLFRSMEQMMKPIMDSPIPIARTNRSWGY